ncbi:MAG: universal stress protein [Gammaproteobacteria bacterium]|nr:hypothetical protein [Gammaproteobacteria bacterium]
MATCPLLIVQSEPLTDYARIAIATDLSATSIRTARTVARMGLLEGPLTWVVHADAPLEKDIITDAKRRATYEKEWKRQVAVQLAPQLAAAGFDLSRTEILVKPARPMDAIDHILDNVRPDLIVIGTGAWFMLRRMLARSMTHQALTRTKCDILVVPPTREEAHPFQRESVARSNPTTFDTAPHASPRLHA